MKPASRSAQNRPGSRRRLLGLLGVFALLAALLVGVSAAQVDPSAGNGPPDGPSGLAKAIAAQERNTERLLATDGVVGTAVGLGADGQPVIKVYTKFAGVAGIPRSLEGVATETEVTGMIVARTDPTERQPRPVPIGVSTGHPDITAGTIGARVKDGNGNVYALSNNHVYANSNDASGGDAVIQPGTYDGGSSAADDIGTLFDYELINFNGGNNLMDAAIASTTTDMLSTGTPSDDGYGIPESGIYGDGNGDGFFDDVDDLLNLQVMKYGRTTKLTFGAVDAVNATVDVCYETRGPIMCVTSARFVDQIIITPGTFSAGGDSGSLIVSANPGAPVGLLFAGSSSHTIANRIDWVLHRFGVTIDSSSSGGGGDAPPTASITNPSDGATVSGTEIVTADATDDNEVTQVEFFVDDVSIGVDSNGSDGWSASWNTTAGADGSYTVSATATDTNTQTASDSVNVTVDNVDDPPSVSITNPSDGATVSGTEIVTADATDDDEVTQVEFFVDDVSIGVDSNGSDGWSASWNTTAGADGSYAVSATATDTNTQTASDSVNVTVDNSAPAGSSVTIVGSNENNGSAWTAYADITVTDGTNAIPGADVEWSWSNGTAGNGTCTTDSFGKCGTISKSGIRKRVGSVTFTVAEVNDVADGTSITILKP